MNRVTRRSLSAALAFAHFATQVALANATEANLWAERRSKAASAQAARPALLAALPGTAPLPPIPGLAAPALRLPARLAAPAASGPGSASATRSALASLLAAVEPSRATVSDVFEPAGAGRAVLVIQDVHLHAEAQANISAVIARALEAGAAPTVAVEGAFGAIDTARFRDLARSASGRRAMDALLAAGVLAAPSHAAISGAVAPASFIGVEDRELYDRNARAVAAGRERRSAVEAAIRALGRRLERARAAALSPALLRLEMAREAFDAGRLSHAAYLETLAAAGADPGLDGRLFLEAHRLETSIDFSAVERERAGVVRRLSERLSPADLRRLLDRSVEYRLGRIGYGDYYRAFEAECRSAGISLEETPAFRRYVNYVLLCDRLRGEAVFASIEKAERDAASRLASTMPGREVLSIGRQLSRIRKLAAFELVPRDWRLYLADGRRLDEISDALDAFGPAPRSYYPPLEDFEVFYRAAEARSAAMANAVAARLAEGNVVVVAGGFHAPDLQAEFRRRGIAHAVVSPRVTSVDSSGTSYLSVFGREKTPLDRLLAGERLFINPVESSVQHPATALRSMAALTLAAGRVDGPIGEAGGRPVFAGWRVSWMDRQVDTVPTADGRVGRLYVRARMGLAAAALVLAAPVLETGVFQGFGLDLAFDHLARFGLTGPSAALLSVGGVAIAFSFAHTIVRWLARSHAHGWREAFRRGNLAEDARTFAFHAAVSAVFSLPFLFLDPSSAFLATTSIHALVNAAYALFRNRAWFPRWWQAASIFHVRSSRALDDDSVADRDDLDRLFAEGRLKEALETELSRQSTRDTVDMLCRVTRRTGLSAEDFTGAVRVGFHAAGTHKQVFRAEFERADRNEPVRILIAVKKEMSAGDISPVEIEDLELLSGETRHTPVFGGRFEHAGPDGIDLVFYIEEFIEGPTARELMETSGLSREQRETVVWALVRVMAVLGQMPKDAHARNFILREEDGGTNAVMVDIGHRRMSVDTALLRVILFYGYFGDQPGSNRFIFDTFVEAFRDMPRDGYEVLQANLEHIRNQMELDRRRGRTAGETSAKKRKLREERGEPALLPEHVEGIVAELSEYLDEHDRPTEAEEAEAARAEEEGVAAAARDQFDRPLDIAPRTDHELLLIEADHGLITTGPAIRFLQERLERVLPGVDRGDLPRVVIASRDGLGLMARSYPNGTILLSPELVRSVDGVEELDAALLMEACDWARRQAGILDRARRVHESVSVPIFNNLAVDTLALHLAANPERGTSARGVLALVRRVHDDADARGRLPSWDLLAGRSSDRVHSLEIYAQLMGLLGAPRPSTPLPPEVSEHVSDLKIGGRLRHLLENLPERESEIQDFVTEATMITRSSGWPLNLALLKPLASRISAIHEGKPAPGTDDDVRLRALSLLHEQIIGRIGVLSERRFEGLPWTTAAALRLLVLEAAGVDNYSRGVPSQTPELLYPFLVAFEMAMFQPTGLDGLRDAAERLPFAVPGPNLLDVVVRAGRHGIRNGVFDVEGRLNMGDYLGGGAAAIAAARRATERHGATPAGWNRGWTDMVLEGVSRLHELGRWDVDGPAYVRFVREVGARHGLSASPREIGRVLTHAWEGPLANLAFRIEVIHAFSREDKGPGAAAPGSILDPLIRPALLERGHVLLYGLLTVVALAAGETALFQYGGLAAASALLAATGTGIFSAPLALVLVGTLFAGAHVAVRRWSNRPGMESDRRLFTRSFALSIALSIPFLAVDPGTALVAASVLHGLYNASSAARLIRDYRRRSNAVAGARSLAEARRTGDREAAARALMGVVPVEKVLEESALAEADDLVLSLLTDGHKPSDRDAGLEAGVPASADGGRPLVVWADTAARVIPMIRSLEREAGRRDRLAVGLGRNAAEVLDALRADPTLGVDRLAAEGRLVFVHGDEDTTVLDLVQAARSHRSFRYAGPLRVLVARGTELPAGFFRLSGDDLESLSREAVVYLIDEALRAVEVAPSFLATWETIRVVMTQA